MASYPVTSNANNCLICIKGFCIILDYPKILQTDRGADYNNKIIDNFCKVHNIKHILSSPYHPKTNGLEEVAHKEIRKNVIISYSEIPDNFNLKLPLLNAVESHKTNIQTVTGYRSIDLIKNIDEDIYNKVIEKIQNKYKDIMDYNELKEDTHILINKNFLKVGKRLKFKKLEIFIV